MANLPIYNDPTLEVMRRVVVELKQAEPQRGYLGASSVGDPCERKLYYQLAKAPGEPIEAAGCFAIEDGHTTEIIVAARLRLVPGVELLTEQPDGTQWGFELPYLSGHVDGLIHGLPQAPKTWHIWENKATNQKSFDAFQKLVVRNSKQALRQWNWRYFIQAQIYMGQFELSRHYLTVCTPGARDITSCRTDFAPDIYKGALDKAKRIHSYTAPPDGVDDYTCNWCRYRAICKPRN